MYVCSTFIHFITNIIQYVQYFIPGPTHMLLLRLCCNIVLFTRLCTYKFYNSDTQSNLGLHVCWSEQLSKVGSHTYWPSITIFSLNLAVSSLILLLICETRMPNAKHKYIYRTLSFVVPFVLANYPFFKMYAKSALVQHYFNIHALSLLIGAIFNVT